MADVTKYTLDEISSIMFNGFSNELDSSVMDIIKELAEKVGAADYVRTPQFQKNGTLQRQRRKGKTGQEISDTDWESIRRFQATEIVRKEGVEASIDKIRVYLNKITNSTFETQKAAIFTEIQSLTDTESSDDEKSNNLRRVGETLFTIASNNSFFSGLYADLYKDLVKDNKFLQVILDDNIDKLNKLFENIEWCNPNEDYDRFCDINKANDSRRATVLFYVNLMKRGLIKEDILVDIIKDLQKRIMIEKDLDSNSSVIEEISELVNVLLVNSWTPDKSWGKIPQIEWISYWLRTYFSLYENVCAIADLKARDFKGLSNKTVFKHMDIRDAIDKLMSES